jgi:hypothetical protein
VRSTLPGQDMMPIASSKKGRSQSICPRPTKYEFSSNRKTATALGINVPSTLLAYADEVSE